MMRRFFSFTSVPHSPDPITRARIPYAILTLLVVLLLSGMIGIYLIIHYHLSKGVDRATVENLETETVVLEGELSRLEREVTLLKKSVGSLAELEGGLRPLVGFDEVEENLPSPGVPDSSERDISSRLDRVLDEVQARRRDFLEVLKKLEEDELLSTRVPSIPPVGGWITRKYGYGEDPFTGRMRFNRGVNIAAPKGTPIHAPADGRVKSAGVKGDLGLLLVLDHGYGVTTYYGHCGFLKVGKGERVRRGEVVATVGGTGRVTGPCLHYEVRIGGKCVDPESLFLGRLPYFSDFLGGADHFEKQR